MFALALLAACSPRTRGVLQPVASAGVETVSTHGLPGDTARLSVGGVTADITGSWNDANETVVVAYLSDVPVTLLLASTATWRGQTAPASGAWDTSAPAPGNAVGLPLLNNKQIALATGAATKIQIEYARTGDPRPATGDEVVVTIPMPQGARAVRFRLAGE